MSISTISQEVCRILSKYDESNIYRLCRAMKITVLLSPMGEFAGACKGFYLSQSRKQVIMVNNNLPEDLQRIIVAHELGHAVLHRRLTGIKTCLLYTSDAADDLLCVDLGGRRIIKK